MDAREAIAKIRTTLVEVWESGQQAVAIPALLDFLRAVEQESPLDSETRKLQHESNLAYYRAQREHAIEMLRTINESGKVALTTNILINGGATVALLAFLGNLAGKSSSGTFATPAPLALAILSFAGGVLLAAMATGLTYATNFFYGENWRRSAFWFHVCTVTFGVGAYLAFLGGMVAAYHAFK